jgi:hypothetical protein
VEVIDPCQSPGCQFLLALASELRSLPSTGVTRLQRFYEPLRHPIEPSLSLAGVRLSSRDSPPWGFPCCVGSPCTNMPSPAPRRDRWDMSLMARPIPTGRLFPNDGGLPQVSDGSAPAYDFSRPLQRSHDITACLLATPPSGVFSRRLRRFRYLHRRSDSYRLERPFAG